ncbi:MAG: LuxR C-terminal-related transcriptional regulator [Tannerellaceae bacterium]|nr:LuxR C-terminal-related transcriptional regulator [Tannerellaceae bacterium]
MQRTKHIAIILSDTLQSTGLQSLIMDYFHPAEISYYPGFSLFAKVAYDSFDYYFTDAETFTINADFFLPRKMKACILIHQSDPLPHTLTPYYIGVNTPQEVIIEQLQTMFSADNHTLPYEGNKELSPRETDVLQLIAKGSTNKEIADKLHISLNTVLSHRKNITAKLGIKTVSGLTFYAIMNGVISADDMEL